MATKEQIQASIDAIDAQLDRGLTRVEENGRSMTVDLAALRVRKAELGRQLGRLTDVPMVRRVLTYSDKGL